MKATREQLIVGAVLLASLCATTAANSQSIGTLSQLEHRTAWIFLGVIDPSGSWATQTHYILISDTAGESTMPRKGDVLETTSSTEVLISGYRRSGERRRLEPPANRIITPDDHTGIVLPSSSQVNVQAVVVEQSVGGLRGVWVRVTPASAR